MLTPTYRPLLLLASSCLLATTAAFAQTASAPTDVVPDVPTELRLGLAAWVDGLTLPVAIATVPGRSDRWLVVQLEGLVIDVRGRVPQSPPFLDLRHRVTGLAGEQGLFTAAVEPLARAAARGRDRVVVVAFTERDSGDLLVAAYPIDEATWTADAAAERELLRVPMPEPFHHGGQVRFGPDGYLYVSVGNGESSNEFLEILPWSAPSLTELRGKILRIDPLPAGADSAPPYAVPSDNPHAADPGALPEIWARGFRNPWKFTFEPATGLPVAADVGGDRWEEVNRVVPGGHHGWPTREGHECLARVVAPGPVDPDCPTADVAAPWIVYGHLALDPTGGQAVVGGVFVRDPDLPELAGRYVFGDYVTGALWAYDAVGGERERLLDTTPGLTAIEEGPDGEVLLVGIGGAVERLVAVD